MTDKDKTPEAAAPEPEAPAEVSVHDDGDAGLLALIDRLADLLERSDLTELEVESGRTGLVLRKASAIAPAVAEPAAPAAAPADGAGPRRAGRGRSRTGRARQAIGQGPADRHLLRRRRPPAPRRMSRSAARSRSGRSSG